MMADNNETLDLQAKLSSLKKIYAEKIPEKVDEIEQSWEKLKLTPEDSETFQLLHRQVHSLSGTAATYGFTEIADKAKTMEMLIQDKLTQDPLTWTAEAIDGVNACYFELEDSAQSILTREVPKFHHLPSTDEQLSSTTTRDTKLIYLVDDDVHLLSVIEMQIEAFGYNVETFSDLTLFDEAVERESPDVVIMDVIFGEGRRAGIEHIARINAKREQSLKTIFVTGGHDVLTRLEAVRANGLAYLTKPLLIDHLIDALDELTHHNQEAPYRIVIVDDSKSLSSFYAVILQQAGMETLEVNDPLKLLDVLAESVPPDLILMEVYMPDCNGLELSKVIRQMDAYVSTPIVFLSSESDVKKQLSALSLGCDDFLTKPIEPWHLVSSVTSRLQRGRMIRKLTETDGLTGLLNYSKSRERLDIELARAKREKTPLSFAMVDIDHFKQVNDSYGHPAGDRVLKRIGNLFKQSVRLYDTVGRYGGEEFAVILPNTDAQTAKVVMDKLRAHFGKINHTSDTGDFCCSFSCGIASFPDFDDSTTINDQADKALYEAKNGGRNQVVVRTL